MSYNEQRISGEYYFDNRRRKVVYDAYPDRVEIDESAWVRDENGNWFPQELRRCLVNVDMTVSLIEELIADEVGY